MGLYEQKIEVRWADLDPNGHVRHSAYYDYCTFARITYWQQNGFGPDWMKRNSCAPVLFREEGFFHREMNAGDELIINLKLSGISDDLRKWSVRHQLWRGEELCATLNMEGAWLNLDSRRVQAPPRALGELFSALQRTEDFRVIGSGRSQEA